MRNISPEIFSDEFFGTLPMMYRVLWIGLLTNLADDQGRLLDNPALIRSLLFPYDVNVTIKDIEKGLALFANKHKIVRYHAGTNGDGRELIQVVNWWRYQKSTQWAAKSQYPSPSKWVDRIRTHVSGGGSQPFTVNWQSEGGFTTATLPLRSVKVAAKLGDKVETTKPQASREREEDVKVKESPLLSSEIRAFSEKVEKLDDNAIKELTALAVPSAWIIDAIDIAVAKNKHRAKYVFGILKNWKLEGRNDDHKLPARKTTTGPRTHRPSNVTAGSPRNASTEQAAELINKRKRERVVA